MPKKPDKLRPDVAETAFRTMMEATGQTEKTPPPSERPKNPEAVARGAAGGKKGGKARAARLTKEERSESAANAANVRWRQRRD